MEIIELELLTDDIDGTEKFYTQILELNLIRKNDNYISFGVGASILTFLKSNHLNPQYHFAFNIPDNKLENRAMEKLKIFGIQDQANKKPNQLSGGEKQRVAIARALINDPLIIMGDEPTGNLDKRNSEIVFNQFKLLASEFHQTLLIVTHDPEFAKSTDRIIEMEDGRILRQ